MMTQELPNLLQSRSAAHKFVSGNEASSATKVAPQCLGARLVEHEDLLREMPRKSKDQVSREEAEESYWARALAALAERDQRERLLKFLRAHRFKDVNSSSGWFFNFRFPLHAAVEENDSEMVRLLIQFKAKSKLRDANGLTARQLARQKNVAGSQQKTLAAFKEHSTAKRKRAETRRSTCLAAAAATLSAVSDGSTAADAAASAAASAEEWLPAASECSIAADVAATSAAESAETTQPDVSDGSIATDAAASVVAQAAETMPAVLDGSIAADAAEASGEALLPEVSEVSIATDAWAAAGSDAI